MRNFEHQARSSKKNLTRLGLAWSGADTKQQTDILRSTVLQAIKYPFTLALFSLDDTELLNKELRR